MHILGHKRDLTQWILLNKRDNQNARYLGDWLNPSLNFGIYSRPEKLRYFLNILDCDYSKKLFFSRNF